MPRGPLTEEHKRAMREGRQRARKARLDDIVIETKSEVADESISTRNTTALSDRHIRVGSRVLLTKENGKGTWATYEGKEAKIVGINASAGEVLVKGDFPGEVWMALHEWRKP